MKIHILGKGLAAMGFLEALLSRASSLGPDVGINWIGPPFEDEGWRNCSRNSTAVVALHGIRRGVSPLGDDLVSAYEEALQFFLKHSPEGVEKCERLHLVCGDEEKLVNRFGEVQRLKVRNQNLAGFKEEALIYRPVPFMKWWFKRLQERSTKLNMSLSIFDDVITSLSQEKLVGLSNSFNIASDDFIIDCRGSGVNELASSDIKMKRAPGHYLVWESEDLKTELGESSWVYTIKGHNLIYHAGVGRLILGGSTEEEGLEAKSFLELKKQGESFIGLFDELRKVLSFESAQIKTGLRPKAPKRRPFLERNGQVISVNGFYKNGYSLCYLYGKKTLGLLLNS